MFDNRKHHTTHYCASLIVWMLVCVNMGFAAAPHDSTFSLVLYAGGGYGVYATSITPPPDVSPSIHRGGMSSTVRLMWHPDHLLRVGVESGWTQFFSYTIRGASPGSLSLSAVPLLLVFSMPVGGRINVFAGAGGYFVSSHLQYGTTVRVNEFSQGWMLAASYVVPISTSLGIAGELKWYNASQFEDGSVTLQVQLVWSVLEW
jgi:hypothetical protein